MGALQLFLQLLAEAGLFFFHLGHLGAAAAASGGSGFKVSSAVAAISYHRNQLQFLIITSDSRLFYHMDDVM